MSIKINNQYCLITMQLAMLKLTMPFRKTMLVFLSILALLFSSFSQAKLTQSVDRLNIHAGETFVLTLQIDEDTDDQPDLSLIPKEFTVISNSQYQQSSYVNGRGTTVKGWKIKLSTLKTGNITLPAISIGKFKSTPIKLFIKDTSDRVTLGGKKKAIFLESEVDNSNVYVQQQIIFTVRLYRAVNTHYARLSEPFAGDSIIEKLGEDVQFNKDIDNTRYLVTERRYAIFPQNSGDLNIGEVNFTADVNDPNQSNRNRFLNTTRPISVNSKAVKITVKPQPAKSDNPWMPATSVVLVDKWSSQTAELTVGEPVTWTILLTAQGLSEAQLPTIELPKVPGLQWYPDTPQKERQVNESGLLAQRIEKLAVIPSKEGSITIPEIKVSWWDVKTDSQKIATLPTRTFNVAASINSQSNTNQTPAMISPINPAQIPMNTAKIDLWKNISAALFILWLITLGAYFLKKGNTHNRTRQNQKNSSNDIAPISLSEKQSIKHLIKSIASNHSSKIESDLIEWVNTFSKPAIFSIGDLLQRISDLSIAQKLRNIEQQRYAKKEDDSENRYSCDLDKNDLEHIRNLFISTQKQSSSNQIPALYPGQTT